MGGRALKYIIVFTFIITFTLYAQDAQLELGAESGLEVLRSENADEETSGAEYRRQEETLLFNGETANEEVEPLPKQSLFDLGDLLRAILVLVLFATGIYLFLFLIKRSQNKHSDSELINLLATRTLQSNRSLHLIEVSKRVFFVSSSEQNISLIAEITEKEELDELRLHAQEQKKRPNRFLELLFPRMGKENKENDDRPGGLAVLRASIEKLERLK